MSTRCNFHSWTSISPSTSNSHSWALLGVSNNSALNRGVSDFLKTTSNNPSWAHSSKDLLFLCYTSSSFACKKWIVRHLLNFFFKREKHFLKPSAPSCFWVSWYLFFIFVTAYVPLWQFSCCMMKCDKRFFITLNIKFQYDPKFKCVFDLLILVTRANIPLIGFFFYTEEMFDNICNWTQFYVCFNIPTSKRL